MHSKNKACSLINILSGNPKKVGHYIIQPALIECEKINIYMYLKAYLMDRWAFFKLFILRFFFVILYFFNI